MDTYLPPIRKPFKPPTGPSRSQKDVKRPYKQCTNPYLRVSLATALNEVDRTSDALDEALTTDAEIYASWFWAPPSNPPLRQAALKSRARRIIFNTEYLEDEERLGNHDPSKEDRREARLQFAMNDLAPGVISASPRLVELAKEFTAARIAIEPLLVEMNRSDRKVGEEDDRTHTHVGKPLLRYALKTIGRSTLNLHRAKRRLVVFSKPPLRIGWTWAIQRRIRRLELETVLNRLHRLRGAAEENARVHNDIRIIETLRARERSGFTLAHITAPHRSPKANVVFSAVSEGDAGNTSGEILERKQVRCVLPLIYPGGQGEELVRIGRLSPLPPDDQIERLDESEIMGPTGRLKRSDARYDHVRQLLSTLPVFAPRTLVREFHGSEKRCDEDEGGGHLIV